MEGVKGISPMTDFFDLTVIIQMQPQTAICQYDLIPEGNTCKVLPTLVYKDQILLLFFVFQDYSVS